MQQQQQEQAFVRYRSNYMPLLDSGVDHAERALLNRRVLEKQLSRISSTTARRLVSVTDDRERRCILAEAQRARAEVEKLHERAAIEALGHSGSRGLGGDTAIASVGDAGDRQAIQKKLPPVRIFKRASPPTNPSLPGPPQLPFIRPADRVIMASGSRSEIDSRRASDSVTGEALWEGNASLPAAATFEPPTWRPSEELDALSTLFSSFVWSLRAGLI
ncbi:hypothetical protein PYCC9005_004465 [Savitreella phatthalungensis]